MLPEWLTEDDIRPKPLFSGKHIKEGYIKKTLHNLRKTVLALFIYENQQRCIFNTTGLSLSALLFIVATSLMNTLGLMLFMAGLILLWGLVIRARYNRNILKLWTYTPAFTSFISIPVLFRAVTPGDPLTPWHGWLAITQAGAITYSVFVLRVSLSTFVLLTLITCKGINQLANVLYGIPVLRNFAFITELTCRYAKTLLLRAEDMYLAKSSRSIPLNQARASLPWIIQETAHFFADSSLYAEELYNSMLSRGFSRDVKKDVREHWEWHDIAMVLCVLCILLSMILLRRFNVLV